MKQIPMDDETTPTEKKGVVQSPYSHQLTVA